MLKLETIPPPPPQKKNKKTWTQVFLELVPECDLALIAGKLRPVQTNVQLITLNKHLESVSLTAAKRHRQNKSISPKYVLPWYKGWTPCLHLLPLCRNIRALPCRDVIWIRHSREGPGMASGFQFGPPLEGRETGIINPFCTYPA